MIACEMLSITLHLKIRCYRNCFLGTFVFSCCDDHNNEKSVCDSIK